MNPPGTAKPLSGKVSLVTGSSRGIGAAIAVRLASLGSNVVINYISSASAAETVAQEARGHGVEVLAIQADVTKGEDVIRLFESAKSKLGRLDIVMSNSGIEHFDDLDKVKEEDIDRVLAVNVKAQLLVAQQSYEHMEDNGRLLLMSSISSVMGIPRHALYASSKAAIQGMVKCLAWDFGKKQITVNCIAPGGVKTDMYTEAAANYIPGGNLLSEAEIDGRLSQLSPLGRPGLPGDVADVVELLVSPGAQWITGQTIHASGGAHMGS